MVSVLCQSRYFLFVPRQFSTSPLRKVRFPYSATAANVVREIGKMTPVLADSVYSVGQLFIHRTFAYRGVVLCSFNCRFHEKKEGTSDRITTNREYYQVLIHRPDWPFMQFPVDITCYLQDGSTRGEKYFAHINGMDCVSHHDILPFVSSELSPIEHDLFDKIFMRDKDDSSVGRLVMRPNLRENYMASQRSWMAPRDVYREVTEGISVVVTTFYLGSNQSNNQIRHMWRYTIRIENHLPQKAVILRERTLKIYALNNMNQANGHGVIGKQPELNLSTPAFQFSSTVELPHSKGCHMWGSFKMEKENGSAFNVIIPTIVLEAQEERNIEPSKVQE